MDSKIKKDDASKINEKVMETAHDISLLSFLLRLKNAGSRWHTLQELYPESRATLEQETMNGAVEDALRKKLVLKIQDPVDNNVYFALDSRGILLIEKFSTFNERRDKDDTKGL